MKKKIKASSLVLWCVAAALLVAAVAFVVYSFTDVRPSREISKEEAQGIVEETLFSLPKPVADGAMAVLEHVQITVKDVSFGTNKDVILQCDYETLDVLSAVKKDSSSLINEAYRISKEAKDEGKMMNATKLRLTLKEKLDTCISSAQPAAGEVTLYLYEVAEGEFSLYLSDEAINAVFGGMAELPRFIDTLTTAQYKNETVDITNNATLRTALKDCFSLVNYDNAQPVTGNFVVRAWRSFTTDFHRNFVQDNRWIYLAEGLGTTLSITALAGLMGVVLGFVVAIVRCTNEMTGGLTVIDKVCRVYLSVIRGTPVMVQLLIIYFVLLLPIGVPKFLSAVLCFGLNSGAYVAEIVRGGIMAIDRGQMEAGRSLGFGYAATMVHFIIPQAFKAVLPALANEFITLLKESSVAFYIGVADLTQGGLKIRSLTYSNYMPLITVALIYLAIVLILTRLVGLLERRLRKSER